MKTILISLLSILLISFIPNDTSTVNETNTISNGTHLSKTTRPYTI